MNNHRWREVERIFDETLEQPEPDRAAFMAQACAGDDTLRHEVESLLAAHQQAGGFLVASTAKLSPLNYGTAAMSAQQRLGPYQLLREIAQGGMGIVWLAARADEQYQQQVAIKLLKAGASNADIAHRLRHERQILAELNHPNIARLLDGGTTDSGQPYLVMEYIEGVPIDEYCQQQNLSVTARLKLFRQVCAALQYAHQNLVIHRDLKPANILVTADGTVKLLDFGIAKLLQPNLTDSYNTQAGMHPMTPAYASPEQIRGESLTTASDVYSLGVVLYELLTGRSPYQLKEKTFGELSKAICEQEPTRPSAAVTRGEPSNDERPTSAIRNPQSVIRNLKGDLDSIVLMALRKEPQARYSSVEQFSADLQRYLDGLPTHARKGTFAYRAVKYVRRHKVPVAAAALIALSLLGGIGSTLRQAAIAQVARFRAESEQTKADAQRLRAENALTTAEERRQQAEAARTEADEHRTEAELQRAFAEEQQLLAEEQKNFADEQRLRAEQGENLKRQLLYAAQMNLAHQAWDKANIERTQELLDAQAPQAGQQDLRGFEWYYLWRLAHNDLASFKHTEAVVSIAQTPGGAKMASQTLNGDIRLWETATGKELAPIHDNEMNATCLTISPDGKFFAQGKSNGRVNIYAVEAGTRVTTLEGSQAEITAVAFSPDGKTLAASSFDGGVSIWAVLSWQPQANFKASARRIGTIVFTPDSQQLFTGGSNDAVKVWHPLTGQELKAPPRTQVHKMEFLRGTNHLVMAQTNGIVAIWDYGAGRWISQFQSGMSLPSLACSPDGKLIAAGNFEQIVRVWNVRTGSLLTTIKSHSAQLSALAFTSDSKGLFSGSYDRTLKLSNIQEPIAEAKLIAQNTSRFNNVAFTRDGRQLISTDNEQVIRTHDLATGKQAQKLEGYQNRPVADNEPLLMVKVAVSPDGKYFATAGGDGTVRLWNEQNERPLQVMRGHTGALYAIAISPDGRYIASGGIDRTVKVWEAVSGRELHTLRGHSKLISAAVFSPQGKFLVTSSEDGTIRLWDYVKGIELCTVRPYTNKIRNLAISPDGKWLALGGDDRYIALLDLATMRVVKTLKGHSQFIASLEFSPDGKRLASGSRDATIKLWELEQGQEVLTLNGHTALVMDIAFSPDGNTLASVAEDRKLLLWTIAPSREVLARSDGTPQPLRATVSDEAIGRLSSPPPRPAPTTSAPTAQQTKIAGWYMTGSQPSLYTGQTDTTFSLSHKASASLMSKQEEIQGSGTLSQSIRADAYRGRRVRFSGYVKSLESGKPAALWFSANGAEGYQLEFGNTTKPATTHWQKYEVVLNVPEDSLTMSFGFILNGSGQLWGDDFRLEIVDADVPVTNVSGMRERNQAQFLNRPEAERARVIQQTQEYAKRLSLKPVNLDFEQ